MMPTINRLTGRFFAVLISLGLAILLPRAAFAEGGTKSPAPTLCQISDTIYRADGSPAQGTVLVSWQAFTTSAGQAVTPGSLLVTLDANGGFNASLAPNTGASPAGSYYTAIFKLSGGTTETEIWVVPNAQTSTIGAIRSKLVPAQQAAQFLTRDYADSTYVGLASTQTITGTKTYSASPAVPTPQNPTDAANKAYVDANAGSGNLASPPPIGNVTPNTATFTVLDNIPNAAAFPGSDPCARINAAAATLPSTGGTVDARGFTGAASCATTINLNLPNLTLLLPAATLTLNGNPGINISAAHVTIACPSGTEGDLYNTVPASLKSGGAYPLIADTVQSIHATDGFTLRNCYLDGNATGTFGLFFPYGSSGHLENVYTHSFTSVGQFILGGQWTSWASSSGGNGGDGLVWGFDGAINGNPQFAGNGGTAVHLVSGGNDLNGVGTYKNRLHGIFLDGNEGGDWTGSTLYIQQTFIRPTSGNAGNFTYFTQIPGTTGSARPTFCQTPGCSFTDGTTLWINSGTAYGYTAGSSMFASNYWNFIKSANSASNGYQAPSGFDADDIRIEGTASNYALQNSILSTKVRQSEGNDYPGHGIHLKYASTTMVQDEQWIGAGFSNRPDLGGIRVENAYFTSIDGINCYASYSNCVQMVGSTDTIISNFVSQNGALAGTPTPQTYALSVDSGSNIVMVKDMDVDDNRSTPYARGVSNAGSNLVVKNLRYNNLASNPDSGAYSYEYLSILGGTIIYNIPSAASYLFQIGGAPALGINPTGVNVGGALTYQNVAGVEYLVSHYAGIQAAINAAYNNGAVLGTVIDDRTAPYSGPGFTLYDSVTLKLAATTYTIASTVTYNNGNNNVTAGIVLVPGAHLVGAGTSTNHGTIITAGNGLNADLIATSTVGTGTGASVQWWHWGEIGNLRILGNGGNQTSGECLKIENMGETARIRDLELSACYSNNMEIIGASATQSAISNVTSNLSVGGAGVAFTNLGGVGVLGGISGDCNHAALIAANFGASGTLQINGLKAEAESSICPSQVQDPVILSTTTDSTVLASIKVDGGYAFGSTQHDFVKSTGPGSIQYLQNNFYLTGYTNILNDTVRSQLLPNLSTTTKQPVSYLSNGTIFGNQAFWFQPNTFIQGNPNGTPTELFGLTSSGGSVLAAPGNGDNANPGTGGIQISSYNRSIFGQTPEPMARWGWRFLGSGGGYDTTKWDLVPVWAAGDSSDRSIGNASTACQNGNGSVSCRWPHIYALNVDTNTFTLNGNSLATVATSGSYNDLTNKPAIPAQGAHLVSGTMQGQTSQIAGTGSYATLYSATIPAGTASVGTGIKCRAYFRHSTGSGTVTMQWKLGSMSQAYATTFTGGNTGAVADIEIFTPSSTNSELVNLPFTYFGGTLNGPTTGLAWSENLTSANTIYLQFNVANTDKLTGDTFYCQTVQ